METTRKYVTNSATGDIVVCGLFAALMFIGAKLHIMIPIGTGVTVSLQIMFALMAGFILGPKLGMISVIVYLIIGLMGVPVFAHGGGVWYLAKPTFGFLIGFAFAALFAGLLIKVWKKKNLIAYLVTAVVAMLSYYVCGLIYFYVLSNFLLPGADKIGVKDLFIVWFFSSVGPDIVIALVAGLAAYRIVPVVRNMQN